MTAINHKDLSLSKGGISSVQNGYGNTDLYVKTSDITLSEIRIVVQDDEISFKDILSEDAQTPNRGVSFKQIDADNDIAAIKTWLKRVEKSDYTHNSYRKEIERFYLWSQKVVQKRLSAIMLEDILEYIGFLNNLPSRWCGPQKPRAHTNWRPFESKFPVDFCGPIQPKSLGQESQRYAIQVINMCFKFLVDAGYLISNPFLRLHKKDIAQRNTHAKVERYLEQDVWEAFWSYLQGLSVDTPKAQRESERLKFLFTLLYLQAPRVSEVSKAQMNDFFKEGGSWWWRVRGKGGKEQRIPVSDEMLVALQDYRTHLGIDALPLPSDSTSLLRSINGTRSVTSNMVYRIVKQAVRDGAEYIRGGNLPEKNLIASKLEQASTHWFRHTSLTHKADMGIDLRYLQAVARHSSIETTQRYLHIDEQKWHDAVDKHKI